MKKCTKCKEDKELDQFNKTDKHKDGLKNWCKLCVREYDKIYQEKNKHIRETKRNEKKHLKKEYDKINSKLYSALNKEKRKSYRKEKYHNDPLFKLKVLCNSYIRTSLKRNNYIKSNRTEEIIGCTIEELKIYLESKFESWMNWNNHGIYNGEENFGWDIDHIIPLSSVYEENKIIELNHYTNLQPLCSKINRDIKGNKI